MNRPDEEREIAPKWIEDKQILATARLEDPAESVKYAAE
jgi:hypothetical protein